MKRTAIALAALLAACTQEAPVDENEESGWGATPAGGSSSRGSNSGSQAGTGSSSSSVGVAPGSGAVSTGGGTSSSMASTSGGGNTEPRAFVWGHSSGSLYVLDADSLMVTNVGPFTFHDQGGSVINDDMTDIAVDSNGNLYGCSFTRLYTIDPDTADAQMIASLSDSYNGLTFVPAGMIEQDELLVGASNTGGTLYKINLTTGVATNIGDYGGLWKSSGDIVAINGDGIYATVNTLFNATDHLATVDPATGTATVLPAAVGFNSIWGLGYWEGVLYGFTDDGLIITIDRTTGVGTQLYDRPEQFWGAGVTTNAKLAN